MMTDAVEEELEDEIQDEEEDDEGDEGKDEEDGKEAHAEITLRQLIQYIAEALVDFPDQVEVTAVESDTSIILDLKVAPDDIGKVIGKGGQTAKAMRKVLSAAATKLRKKSMLQIIE